MPDSDFYWLVGLLEGEGCFVIGNGSPEIILGMTDSDVVARVAALLDRQPTCCLSRSHAAKGWKPTHRVRVCGKPALELMAKLQPHMGTRRAARIQEILDAYQTP